jgi:hypothetical protein
MKSHNALIRMVTLKYCEDTKYLAIWRNKVIQTLSVEIKNKKWYSQSPKYFGSFI